MEEEPRELEIQLEPENFYISPVTSVNGQTGDVVLKTSDLENDSNYQNATEVSNAISVHNQSTSAHQDIRQAISDEATARLNADNGLQGQIDAITSSSDVVDIVGTYADLQNYDTQHLQDNDVIKVLQDETHNDAMTYWRWDKETETWTYIGAEGPYYTKSETNTLLNDKLDADEVPDGFFDGPATVSDEGTSLELSEAIKFKDLQLLGNSEQQTYTGKNLWNPTPYNNNHVIAANGNVAYVEGGAIWEYATVSASTQYTISFTATTGGTLRVHSYDSGGNWIEQIAYKAISNNETASLSFTTPSTIGILRWSFYNDLTTPQLEVGSSPTEYEIYVGGTPSPNPSYPQTVHTVAGEQTITITNGDVQNVYTVDLGSIELVKIGDYQDYIYKSGDDWYVHKEVGKIILNGTQSLNLRHTTANNIYTYSLDTPFDYKLEENILVLSEHFVNLGNVLGAGEMYNRLENVLGVALYYNPEQPTSRGVYFNSNVQLPTWLVSNNVIIYYILVTPTDTKITDTGLIAQLNKLFNGTLYQPNTSITSTGDLAAILNVEAFTDNLNSLIEIASEPDDDVFVGTDGVNAGVSGLVPAPQATDAGKFLKADGTWASGGGGGTSYTAGTGIDITSDVISVDTSTIQAKLTAGSNVNISAQNVISATDTTYTAGTNVSISAQNVISATDTTYSDFTGTDGNTGGSAGLVPAPTTSDVDKFLKSDGTWATAGGGGGGPTVVQTTGTSTTDVMSQNATTAMVYNDPSTMRKIKIGGGASSNEGTDAIEIGRNTVASSNYGVAIGSGAQATTGQNNVALGANALTMHRGSVALGSSAETTVKGQIMVGTNNTYDGYNSTNYRLVSGVHDGQSAQDAVTVNQVNSVIDAINTALSTNIPHIGA